MKTLCTDALTILIDLLFERNESFNLLELQQDVGRPKTGGKRTGIEVDLIL
ncbi:MAG: hypothetical protein SFV55_22325 [Haliscomenobacter sp.]|uniref:hypothetical protein n=1 Tax=Haliscomenobacter sp. TaxID=2717303 RepID=UPI0029A33245|nr:hypothetical protein [Haliscomenobacter sp.]MDX2071183.1 hypothetical protein [Haliscomenobacter sp.]